MKYLKKFNEELKSVTYKSAADKLKNQHPARSKELNKFGDIRLAQEQEEIERLKTEKEYKEWQDDIKRYSPFGLFTFTIKPDGLEEEFTEDFYLKVTHWYDEGHYGEIEPNSDFWLNLDFFLVPKDMEGFDKLDKLDWDWKNGYERHIWRGYVNVELKESYCHVKSFVTDTADNVNAKIEIADRKTALKFKRLMSGIFSNKEYPDYVDSYHETEPSLYNAIEITLAESGVSSDYGLEMSSIADVINKMSVNTLYKSN